VGRAEDAARVARAREGNLDAFDELVREHGPAVYRVAYRLLGDRADAEDAAQDAFLQAWRSLRNFRADSAFSTWMYRIATNRCLDELRRRRETEPLDEEGPSQHPGPEQVVVARSEFEILRQAIDTLSVAQRAALILREFEGLSYEEIAQILDISVSAVKSRIHRARIEVLEAMGARS
jgi:RNA polymerase sigma-70 factor (ECF subfamily)